MPDTNDNFADRITTAGRNIEYLTAQATGDSGAAAVESIDAKLSDQQDVMNELLLQQEGLEDRSEA